MFRVGVLIVVVVVHVGLMMLFSSARSVYRKTEQDEQTMTVVFLPETPSASQSNPAPEAIRQRPATRPTRAATHAEISTLTPSDSTAITSSEIEAPPPPTIDWAEEAKLAASRQIDSLEQSRNRGAGNAAPRINLETRPRPKPEFGWARAQPGKIEPLPEGGMLIWINERCALVINGGLLPICKLHKTPARGDLFEHMHDAPDPDDWKQPP
jgi:hypothetical protein